MQQIDVLSLSSEDCKYLLRAIEMDAYGTVLCALRAQGPLTDYKRALLDHLRAALFISLNRHKVEVRRVANDEGLLHLSKTLNPLSDHYYDWAAEGRPAGENGDSALLRSAAAAGDDDDLTRAADDLAALAARHNDLLDDSRLIDLIQLPKQRQVPELVRECLRESEETASKEALRRLASLDARSEVATISRSTSPASTLELRPDTPASSVSTDTSNLPPTSTPRPQMTAASLANATDSPPPPPTTARRAVARKPRSPANKPPRVSPKASARQAAAEATCVCARVRPFRFAPAAGLGQKPPRGNPDRRVTKRPIAAPSSHALVPALRPVGQHHRFAGTVTQHVPQAAGAFTKQRRYESAQTAAYAAGAALQTPRGTHYNLPPRISVRQPFGTQYYARTAGLATSSSAGVVARTAVRAAYSNPTRPYYGNPSAAAALGIHLRPVTNRMNEQFLSAAQAQRHQLAVTEHSAGAVDSEESPQQFSHDFHPAAPLISSASRAPPNFYPSESHQTAGEVSEPSPVDGDSS